MPIASALARLEARVGLADHEDLAATADHLAVAVTGLRRLQGGQDLHDEPRQRLSWMGVNKNGASAPAAHSSRDFDHDSSACVARGGYNARMPDITDRTAPVLASDGPAGSGKGTIRRRVAEHLGWHYLDTGALSRAVGVAAGWADLDLDDAGALVRWTFD